MAITIPRIISLLIALSWAVAFAVRAGGVTLQVGILWAMLFIFLGMIWLPDRLGLSAGWGESVHAQERAEGPNPPDWMVAAAGWFLLVLIPPLVFFLYLLPHSM